MKYRKRGGEPLTANVSMAHFERSGEEGIEVFHTVASEVVGTLILNYEEAEDMAIRLFQLVQRHSSTRRT